MVKANPVRSVDDFLTVLSKNDGKPLYELTPQEARQVLLQVQGKAADETDTVSEETSVALENGRSMRVLIIRPSGLSDALPVIFYIHGGGWVMGDDVTHARLVRNLAAQTAAAVVFPVYEQSPEAQYPQTVQDLFSVLSYMAEYGAKYNLDMSRLIVAGDSVGGNMATVMALMAKEQGNMPKIDFQLLLYPVTDADFYTQSYKDFADGPWLTRKAMEWFWKQYAPDVEVRKEIYACPLKADDSYLQGLPPALIITDENDVLRDEGEAYARKLDAAGVPVSSVRINGTIHDFLMLNPLADSLPTKTAMMLITTQIRDIFAQKTDKE